MWSGGYHGTHYKEKLSLILQCEYCQQHFESDGDTCCSSGCQMACNTHTARIPDRECIYGCGRITWNRYGCRRCKEKRLLHLIDDYMMMGE